MFYVGSRILILAVVFVGANLLLWYPWVKADGIAGIETIFARIFPLRRGIFEDKVASFWCVLHNFYKVNTIYERPTQLKMTTIVTLIMCVPSLLILYRKPH